MLKAELITLETIGLNNKVRYLFQSLTTFNIMQVNNNQQESKKQQSDNRNKYQYVHCLPATDLSAISSTQIAISWEQNT